MTSVVVEVPATTVTALAGTAYEEKIKDKPEVLGGHTEAEFDRAKDATIEGVDSSSRYPAIAADRAFSNISCPVRTS